MAGAGEKEKKGGANSSGERRDFPISGCLLVVGIVVLSLFVGVFLIYQIGVKAVSLIEKGEDRLSAVLPYGYGVEDIVMPLFDFTMRVVREEMEPEMIFKVLLEIFSALEDGVLTEGEFRVIIDAIYAGDKIYL